MTLSAPSAIAAASRSAKVPKSATLVAVAASTPAVADFGADSSYLDIPAFLRRQAD